MFLYSGPSGGPAGQCVSEHRQIAGRGNSFIGFIASENRGNTQEWWERGRWIFILPTSTEDNCLPFLSDWPSHHLCTYRCLFIFPTQKLLYKVVLKVLVRRRGTGIVGCGGTSRE